MNLNRYKLIEIKKTNVIENSDEKTYNMVHDLTVANDHSYVVNDIIVHNCLTSKQTTIGYPMASLIMECRKEKIKHGLWNTQIVADGGMKDYSDVILALALGADYVMIGSLLNKSLESCADTYLFKRIKINQYSYFAKWLFKNKFKLTKKYRGMSTKEVQRKWKKAKLKTSEGISKKQNVEYTLEQWVENFEDYLRSAMSYSNAENLVKFIGYAEIIKISDKSYQRFNK